MFGSGSTDTAPRPEQKPLGLDERRLPTNEQARPVPLMYGRQRLGVTFISQAFNQKAEAVTKDVGKKSDPVVTGYNYRCDFAALVCHGPVDSLDAIFFDEEQVWPDAGGSGLARGAAASDSITITNFGVWTWYWGTEDQGIDPQLAALWHESDPALQIEEHSAYLGIAYFVAVQQFLGYQKTNVQNIEVVVTRKPTKHFGVSGEYSAWLTGATVTNDVTAPLAIADLLVNARYGLGLPDADATTSRLNRSGFQAVASSLQGELAGLAPIITRQQSVSQLIAEMLQYVDGWWALGLDGKITLGLAREAAEGATLPVVDELAVLDPPRISNPGYGRVANRVAVRWSNPEFGYQADAIEAKSAMAHAALSNPTLAIIDRPWATTRDFASSIAGIAARTMASPKITGEVRLRKSKLQGMALGSLFRLHWAHWGLCNLRCRATEIELPEPFSPVVNVEFEVDRTHLYGAAVTPAPIVEPKRIVNLVPDITKGRIIELPYHRDLREDVRIGFLVARPSKMVTAFAARYDYGDGQYGRARVGNHFAATGVLAADYSSSDSGPIQLTLDGIETGAELASPTLANAGADQYVLLVESSDGLDEIMSPYAKDTSAPPTVKYSVLRERWDTAKRSHLSGARWWLIAATSVAADAWPHYGDTAPNAVTQMKLVAGVLGREGALGSALAKSVTLTDRSRRPWKPAAVSASPTSFNLGSTIVVNWTKTHRQGVTHAAVEMPGPVWVIEARPASEAVGSAAAKVVSVLAWEKVTVSLPISAVLDKLGVSAQNLRLRVFARSGLVESRHYDDLLLTYSP